MRLASCSSPSAILFCFSLLVLVCSTKGVIQLPSNVTIPAVLVFGDSIVDPGNNNYLSTLLKCNFPPYGRDFMGGKPTGRFCDGKIPSDIIAEELGIGDLIPAYLDPTLKTTDFLTGVSFASGGSGYDPLTPKIVSVLSLSDQMRLFQQYIKRLKEAVGEEKTNDILTNSIYLVVAGSDDIANTYFISRLRKLRYDIPAYTDLMVNSSSNFLQELYGYGARRIAVFGTPPLGCLPSQRTLAGGKERVCAEDYNEASQLFNTKLSSTLDSLNENLPNAKMVYIDIYASLLDLIQNPNKNGFKVADKGCCGTGKIEVVVLCNQLSPHTCANAADYIFWDSYHPTEKAYKKLISRLLVKYMSRFF